jgi:hypothetical protein
MIPHTDYTSARQARVDELKARISALTLADVEWLISELEKADWHLEELKDRVDDAGSLMRTDYVSSAIDYTRWSRMDPRGPVVAHRVR